MSSSDDQSSVQTVRDWINSEIEGMYTISFARVLSVDDQRRAEVSLKRSNEVVIDNVPVASLWAADGAGVIVPVGEGAEGLLFHAKEPLEKQIQQRGEQAPEKDLRFQLEDAVFMPMLWLDEDSVPAHDSNEFVIEHDSGTRVEIAANGSVTIDATSVTLGDPDNASKVLTEDAQLTDSNGESVSIDSAGSSDTTAS